MKTMKKIVFVSLFQLIVVALVAQAPVMFNYQAVIRDNLGNPTANEATEITISIIEGSVDGFEVFSELHDVTTNDFGIVNLQIGSIEDLSVVDWSSDIYFVEVMVNDVVMGTSQLLSVPMALNSKTTDYYEEMDPYFVASPANMITDGNVNNWNAAAEWGDHAGLYLASDYVPVVVEADPIYTMAPASTITNDDIIEWSSAYTWGDHDGLYLPIGYSETDPIYTMAPASTITNDDIIEWSSAYTWGDHDGLYLPIGYSETDPIYTMAPASSITNDDITDWSSAYSWGNHDGLYLLSDYSETDPVYTMAPASTITNDNITDWSAAYSWGDHDGLYLPSDYTPDNSNLVNLTDDQDIAGTKNFTGTVTVPTPTNDFDAVPKEYVDELLARIEDLEVETGLKMRDASGNIYNIVTIGTQTWMQENLKTERYRNNVDITFINDNATWNSTALAAYCQATHDPANEEIYGNLYNWDAVNTGILCPSGWHVPTSLEWQELFTYLEDNGFGYSGSGSDIAKSLSSEELWYDGYGTLGTVGNQTHLNNSSGFTARPSSFMRGSNDYPGSETYFWASNEYNATNGYKISWMYSASSPNIGISDKSRGFSVRCLKD